MGLFYYSLSLTNCKAAKMINTAGKCHGTLVTFDDITQLEEKNFELNDLVEKLQLANDEIHVKSQELETLANCDPLTLCLNRRSLALSFNTLFTQAKDGGAHLSYIMVDIDFFTSVYDNYGLAAVDQADKALYAAKKNGRNRVVTGG